MSLARLDQLLHAAHDLPEARRSEWLAEWDSACRETQRWAETLEGREAENAWHDIYYRALKRPAWGKQRSRITATPPTESDQVWAASWYDLAMRRFADERICEAITAARGLPPAIVRRVHQDLVKEIEK